MSDLHTSEQVCVIIGASHAGVNLAFALRREGWEGAIHLYDVDPMLPYQRPPLSKAYLSGEDKLDKHLLKSAESYERENIHLHLGVRVDAINRTDKSVRLADGTHQSYDKLVLATGARPCIPAIPGIKTAHQLFPMRTATDAIQIREAFEACQHKQVLVIGGGYIGLETAASLQKLGAEVILLEREERVLARVTAPEMSTFFEQYHAEKGVEILTSKNVRSIETAAGQNVVYCTDGTRYTAEMIVVGTGIEVNTELAAEAGLAIEDGIRVDETARTEDADIYAIGDCTFHFNPHYGRYIRLESVQNAVEQAKVAAQAICGQTPRYDSLPWFWSDQFDLKLQIVGLADGYEQALIRKEAGEGIRFSVWYFKGETLLAVDAVNNPRAYMMGMRLIKSGQKVDKVKLVDPEAAFKPANLILP